MKAMIGSLAVLLLCGAAAATEKFGDKGGPKAAASPAAKVAIPPPRTLDDLIAVMEREARKAGVDPATVRRVLAGFERLPEVADLAASQTEHERTVAQYVNLLVSAERIEQGRAKLAEYKQLLADVEARFGVDRHTLTALWGVETRYGAALGGRPVVRALTTLALEDPRRPEFWRAELLQALRIVERGDIAAAAMLGSWAGAIGHTQFMPSTFNRFAIDFDADGRRDLMGSVADGLASAANYLSHSGWQRGETWGFEVSVPEGFDYALSAPTPLRPLAFWKERGLKRSGGEALPVSALDHRLLLPSGANGPAFLVNRNFGALLRYNPAIPYALAVAHLGDRIGGAGGISKAWPNEPAMPRADRQEMQERLAALGHETGGVDGIIGSLTRNAIRSYQKTLGLPEDGHPSLGLLERLRVSK
jgi:membrane-bound lytic murein transglycosylase B